MLYERRAQSSGIGHTERIRKYDWGGGGGQDEEPFLGLRSEMNKL